MQKRQRADEPRNAERSASSRSNAHLFNARSDDDALREEEDEPTESWWTSGLSREAFQQRARVEAARMARSKKFSNVKWTAS